MSEIVTYDLIRQLHELKAVVMTCRSKEDNAGETKAMLSIGKVFLKILENIFDTKAPANYSFVGMTIALNVIRGLGLPQDSQIEAGKVLADIFMKHLGEEE